MSFISHSNKKLVKMMSYTKVSDKMIHYANSADPDQAAHSGSTLLEISLNILRNNCIKIKFMPKKYGIIGLYQVIIGLDRSGIR